MSRLKLSQAVIVEGRYDKIKLSSIIDANIIETGGFSVFQDKEKLDFIRRLAEKTGVIILTDSDAAGFKIRSYICGSLPNDKVINIYIPDVFGKEKRKKSPSSEGKLGVEGTESALLLRLFEKAKKEVEDEKQEEKQGINGLDLFEAGLSGGKNSAEKRRQFLTEAGLPARLSTARIPEIFNLFYDRDEFDDFLKK